MALLEKILGGPQPKGDAPLKGKAALIVEDEEDIRKLLTIHLRHLGLRVVDVDNTEDAEDLLNRGEHFDIFLLDINMPGENGIAFALRLRQRPSTQNTPILILTGVMSDEGLLNLEKDIPHLVAMSKPFNSKEVKEIVLDLLRPRRTSETGETS